MIKKEIDDIIGDKPPTAADLNKLQITRSILKETMRMWPVFPFIGREAVVDHIIGENTARPIKIPAGTNVILHLYRMYRDPNLWENPDTFDPLRFMRNTEHRQRRHSYQFIPFGGGKRSCIGNHFALMEMLVIICCIFQRFGFTFVSDQTVCPFISITMRARYGVKVDAHILNK